MEREKSTLESTGSNFMLIWTQVDQFFSRGEEYALARGYQKSQLGSRALRTNGEWLDRLGLVEFLRTVGRVVRIPQMLARQSVKTRMTNQVGISFAEFTYQLLQSFDYWWLWKYADCRLQVATSIWNSFPLSKSRKDLPVQA